MRDVEIAIVGGGPAGLSAALEAVETGAEVVLLEEYETLGGQIFRQPPDAFAVERVGARGSHAATGAELIRQLRATNVEPILGAVVVGAVDDKTLVVHRGEAMELIRPGQIILATGGQEKALAFPGWTLPGVMMGGAAQALLLSQGVLVGKKVLMAGAGPLQLKVASQLLDAGAEITAILEASSRPAVSMENALKSFGHWGKMRQGLEYWLNIKRKQVPYLHQTVPVRALGTEQLQAVVIAEVDANGNVLPGSERTVEADTLCLSYGFLPNVQLAHLIGCKLVYDDLAGGWIVWHDDDLQTSVEGVYVAGEVGGIGGVDVAVEEGKLAALAAARALGRIGPDDRRSEAERARGRLAQAKRFARVTNEMMRLRPGLYDLMTDETTVCRCEEVTAGRIKSVLATSDATVRGVKVRTRAGMGLCQGRLCGNLIAHLIARQTGRDVSSIEPDRHRPPVKPVPLEALITLDEDAWHQPTR